MTQQTIEFSHMPSGARGSMAMHHATIGLSLCEGRVPGLHDVPGVRVRPVRPADADTIQEFVRRLSLNSRRSRFFATITELAPETLARFTESAGRGSVLLAEAHDGKTWCMVALAQYALCDGGDDTCEIALVVADEWQQRGLGRALTEILVQSARDARCVRAVADVLCDNEAMLALGRACDFTLERSPFDATMVRLARDLRIFCRSIRPGLPRQVRRGPD